MTTETMTVNGVVRCQPDVQPIFKTFWIDWTVDGDCFLDELCWWRGLDVEAILRALQQARHTAVDGKSQELDGQDVTYCPNHGVELRSKER